MSNTKKLFSQIIKFGFVGGTAFVIDAGLLFLLTEFCGEEFDGVISGVTKWGAYVELENTVEGLAHVADMWDDHYEFYEQSYELVGEHTGKTYKPGQKVRICVTDADKLQRTVNFRIL